MKKYYLNHKSLDLNRREIDGEGAYFFF